MGDILPDEYRNGGDRFVTGRIVSMPEVGSMEDLQEVVLDLKTIVLQKDEEIGRLEDLLMERDQEIEDLKSQLDKYQSVMTQVNSSTSSRTATPRRQRMHGISAEPRAEVRSDEVFKHYPKPAQSKELIRQAFLNNDFLRHLDTAQVEEIVDCCQPLHVAAGCLIIREGDAGSLVYVMEEGRVEVTKEGKYLTTMSPGKVFGELAILYDCTRTASVTAIDSCRLWAINRQCFQAIMMRTGLRRMEEAVALISSIDLFKELPNEAWLRIADLAEEETFTKGEYVVRQGSRGDLIYIVSRGQGKVTQNMASDDGSSVEKFVGFVEPGDCFGDRCLKGDDVRHANVVASSSKGLTCLTIDKKMLQRVLDTASSKAQQARARLPSPPTQLPSGASGSPLAAVGNRTGQDLGQTTSKEPDLSGVRLCDLTILTTLGVGGFGRVELVRLLNDHSRTFALKQMKKAHIVETKQQQHIINERRIMIDCRNDFVVRLYKTFKDRKYLYMLMEACLGGEVWTILRDRGHFDDTTARFYCACVLEALDFLHQRGIIYRDLKPENMLLDRHGYVKLVDFGFSKQVGWGKKTWTFCGTPEYVAPEVILNKGHDFAVDFWSFGVLMFELLTGSPPFTASDPMKTYNLILKGVDALDFPRKMSKHACALIKKLCRENPAERIGCTYGGIFDIRRHKWYDGFNFDTIRTRKQTPPIMPVIRDVTDTSNFDEYPCDKDPPPPDDMSGWDDEF